MFYLFFFFFYSKRIFQEQDSGNDDDYSDSEDYEFETDLESFDTVLDGESAEVDEYILFKETLFSKGNKKKFKQRIGLDLFYLEIFKTFNTLNQFGIRCSSVS